MLLDPFRDSEPKALGICPDLHSKQRVNKGRIASRRLKGNRPMSKQLALLSSGTAALAMIAAPAVAQDTVIDDRYAAVSEGVILADDLGDGWEDEVSAGATYVTDGESIYIDEDLDSGVVYETYERGAQRTDDDGQ